MLAQALLSHLCNRVFIENGSIATFKEQAMNWDRVEGNWKQMTGKVKEQWGKLTDDAIAQIGGQRDQLVGKTQEAYGISRDEADRQVKEWEKLH
jgi:uncharacterized protein YjbJ (UPF0337 family)